MLTKLLYQYSLQKAVSHFSKSIAIENICQGLFFDIAQIDDRIFIQTTRDHRAVSMNTDVVDNTMATALCSLMRQ